MTWEAEERVDEGRYTIERVLGMGRFAVTYLAIDHESGDRVAIKTLNDSAKVRSDLAKVRQVFWDEAMQLKGCDHPHVVKVDRLFEADGAPCVVMEYVAGSDLQELGRLSVEDALSYVQQIGSALDYIHAKGFIHRDVRPANIRVRAGQKAAVLLDFGSALAFADELSTTQTASHASGFAAPEAYASKGDRGPQTDIYSLGATLYFLLEGKAPPDAPTRHDRGLALTFSGRYDPALTALIERAMAWKVADRPRSAAAWLNLAQPKPVPNGGDRRWTWEKIAGIAGIVVAVGTLLSGLGAIAPYIKIPLPVASPSPSASSSPGPTSTP